MKTAERPFESHMIVANSLIDQSDLPEEEKKLLKAEMRRYLEYRLRGGRWFHPWITKFHTDWYREIYRIAGNADPYKEVKDTSNEKAIKLVKYIRPTDLRDIIMLTIIGNRIDYGAPGLYDINKLEDEVDNLRKEKFDIDDTDELAKRIKNAKNVFYLLDNSGEMIFDTLLLDYIKRFLPREKIFLVAKESPMLNDVDISDLLKYKMERYGIIVSTGSNCFGLHEEEVSQDFKDLFKIADLVIAKGQSYLEFFMEYNFSNIFHILRVKQEIKGNTIHLMPGMNIVMNSERYSGKGSNYKWNWPENTEKQKFNQTSP